MKLLNRTLLLALLLTLPLSAGARTHFHAE
jgi:hypothetical protein